MFIRMAYRRMSRNALLKIWRVNKISPLGVIVLMGVVFSAVLGLDTTQAMTYQLFTFLMGVVLVAGVAHLYRGFKATAEMSGPRYASAGQPFVCKIKVKSLEQKPIQDLQVAPILANYLPPYAVFKKTLLKTGYFKTRQVWETLTTKLRNTVEFPKFQTLPALMPRQWVEVEATFTPLKRGHVRFGGVNIAKLDPLGLFRNHLKVVQSLSVMVLPKRYKIRPFSLNGNRKYQQGGVIQASNVGDTEEFIGLRDYRQGDPLHKIHWKSYAKVGHPIVKEFQDEYFERHALILDTELKTTNTEIFEEAVSLAASFVCAIDMQDTLLDLMFVESQFYSFTAGRGQLQPENMMETLAGVDYSDEAESFTKLQACVQEKRSQLSSAIVILLSWDEAREKFVKSLGIPCKVFIISEEYGNIAGVTVLKAGHLEEGLK